MQPNNDQQNTVRGITLVPEPATQYLNEKQELDYRSHRRDLIRWCLAKGKNPAKAEGYSEDTIRVRAGHIDRFYRWCWEERDGYTVYVTQDDADAYMDHLAFKEDLAASTKAKYQKSVKMLWKWLEHERDGNPWDPEITFSEPSSTQPREYLTLDERRRVREASLSMGSVPHYKSVTPEKRQEWKKYIAVILEKPLGDIAKSDWEEINGWKETSLIHTALDAGLRPVEVRRARTSWVDLDNEVLRIPKDESSKNRDNWVVALTTETTNTLDRWLTERGQYEKYDDNDALWLTRRANPYSSSSLKGVLHRACEEAGIDTDGRDMTWYALRHSTGTFLAHTSSLASAQSQLRHRSAKTTMKYDNAPIGERRDALRKL
ncbi:tyrosine-type recombinase/integrase [Halorussus aquaticus]|uniref:Tyrosine-type recombinase/integrase n=1 Tax=Halorussus aquaticus TaxID=2953748 RepID=A0ABD5Q3R8_9EURY|nr:site-specific integrase [Halorussus aquaticus]